MSGGFCVDAVRQKLPTTLKYTQKMSYFLYCYSFIPTIRKYDDFAENVAILVEKLRTFTYLLVLDFKNSEISAYFCCRQITTPAVI